MKITQQFKRAFSHKAKRYDPLVEFKSDTIRILDKHMQMTNETLNRHMQTTNEALNRHMQSTNESLNRQMQTTNDNINRIIAFMLAGFSGLGGSMAMLYSKVEEDKKELDKKIDKVSNHVDQLGARVDKLGARVDQVIQRIDEDRARRWF